MIRVLRALLVILGISATQLASAATYVVTNVLDSGPGSLRQAILDANANGGPDEIHFAIGSGPQTIALTQVLPDITDPVTINGQTQPGYTDTPLIEINGALAPAGQHGLRILAGNSRVFSLAINGFLAQFLVGGGHGIVLDGGGGNYVWGNRIGTNRQGTSAVSNQGDGVLVNNSSGNSIGCTAFLTFDNIISGNGNGIRVLGNSNNNIISGNYIGVDVTGSTAIPNFNDGIAIFAGSNNGIGTAGPCVVFEGHTYRNVISGNGRDGIYSGGTGTHVRGNLVGWNAAATAVVPNAGDGIELNGANAPHVELNNVGGNGVNGILLFPGTTNALVEMNDVGSRGVPGAGNGANGIIISGANLNTLEQNTVGGNGTNGIRIRSGAAQNHVYGNIVGLDATGTTANPNGDDGIEINDGANLNAIGGTDPADANVIGFNMGNGVLITDATTMNNGLHGNFIGVRSNLGAAPNVSHGVAVTGDAFNNVIGAAGMGAANDIHFNGGAGIYVESGTQTSIQANRMGFNGGLGIDLAPLGINPNDALDPDTGPNLGQNFPLLNSASGANGQTTVTGTLNSLANSSFRIDFYASGNCDPSGNGEGGLYLDSVVVNTDAAGDASISANLPVVSLGRAITATASDDNGNTSEFSACIFTPLPVVSQLQADNGPAAGGTPFTITGLNFQTGASVTVGGQPVTNVTVLGPTSITAESPALPAATLNDVVVTNPDGQAGTLPNGWLSDPSDVPQAHGFHDFVERIFRARVTAGCGFGLFCVDQAVARNQMAVFLLIAKNGSGYTPPPATGTVFFDVPASGFAAAFIEALAAANVTSGCGGGNFCPADPVTRAQMSVLILRTLEGPTYNPPPATGTVFLDVPIGAFAAAWIEELADRGITSGCGGGNFCSDSSTTRGQMGVFLAVAFML